MLDKKIEDFQLKQNSSILVENQRLENFSTNYIEFKGLILNNNAI